MPNPPANPAVKLATLPMKLAILQEASWLPPDLIALVTHMSRAQQKAGAAFDPASLPVPPVTATAADHANGAPLLRRTEFPYDTSRAEVFLRTLQSLLSRLGGPLREASQTFGKLKAKGKITPQALFSAHLQEDRGWFEQYGQEFAMAPGFLPFLAQATLSPFVHAFSLHLGKQRGHEASSIWTHGHCPHCGGLPLIGELHGTSGQRLHTCSFCLVTYRAKRVQCPFCLEESPQKLSMFTADTEAGYQAHICRSCNGYIKLADFRAFSERSYLPALDDVLSLPLDMMAQREGFARSTQSAWGF